MNEGNKKIREEITNNLIEAIKNGTAPWQKPWEGRGAPQNAISGRQYNGINQLILTYQGLNFDGGKDPRWLTFKQANDNGWKIKKGAKGTHVVLWKPLSAINEETEETESRTYLGTYKVTAYAETGNPCANGNYPTTDHTIACNSLPFGSKVYIDGVGYRTVEDRGASWHEDEWIDLYLGDVNSCIQWGVQYKDIFLVEE